jgi:hypothetical protein
VAARHRQDPPDAAALLRPRDQRHLRACANFDIPKKTADVTVDSEVRNDSGERATVSLSVAIVDHRGQIRARFESDPVAMQMAKEKS